MHHNVYTSVGANRSCSVTSADPHTGIVAFGAGRVVALWDPRDVHARLTRRTLPGHGAPITTLKHLGGSIVTECTPILSGDEQGHVICWIPDPTVEYSIGWQTNAHKGAISALGSLTIQSDAATSSGLMVTGGNDGLLKLFSWNFEGTKLAVELSQTIQLGSRMPLDIVISKLPGSNALVMAVALTEKKIRLYTSNPPSSDSPSSFHPFSLALSLEGHEDWVRSLDLVPCARTEADPTNAELEDLMLASGSQDNYIRLWRITPLAQDQAAAVSTVNDDAAGTPSQHVTSNELDDDMLDEFERKIAGDAAGSRQLSTKAHVMAVQAEDGLSHFGISLEALLIGHESKLTNLHFSPPNLYASPHLLSTATDNSMIIWAPQPQGPDATNTLWLPVQRFGELGAGRSLGLFGAIWSVAPASHADGNDKDRVGVIANGWNGGLQRWTGQISQDDQLESDWTADLAPTGHLLGIKDLSWDPFSSYLVSVSTDQTSRIHAPCRSRQQDDKSTTIWGELGRPQIHGYDMTTVAFLDRLRFASGADEKVVRIFDAPKGFAESLYGLGVTTDNLSSMASAVGASVPPLGLSNRALDQAVEENDKADEAAADRGFNHEHISISDEMHTLPTEAVLASATLWPEIEKLYGHGYEIMTIAASPSGHLLATACKATTPDHAVIRIYDTTTWKQVGSPLPGHSLTIVSIRFSRDGKYVLSASRDRTWRLFKQKPNSLEYEPVAADRSHARIVWDCAWSPNDAYFCTVSRDKQIKTWARRDDSTAQETIQGGQEQWVQVSCTKLKDGVTAVDVIAGEQDQGDLMAVGLENGGIEVFRVDARGTQLTPIVKLEQRDAHVEQVTRLAWRKIENQVGLYELASCSEDRSVKVTSIQI